jgi:hypothetical protein
MTCTLRRKRLLLLTLPSHGYPMFSLMKSSQFVVPDQSITTFSRVSSLETHRLLFK